MNLANVAVAVALGAVLLMLIVIAELDRRAPHNFAIRLVRSHLTSRRGRGRWRWYLHPAFTPNAVDVIIGADRAALAGWARTPFGALYAARRSRRRLEHEIDRDRAGFLALLIDRGVVESDTRAIFPAETRQERA